MQVGNQTWGDPTPALLFGLAAGLTPLGLCVAGRIPAEAGVMIGAYLFGIALSNIICGLILLRRGDTLWGSLAMFFGTMLCAAGAAASALHTVWALSGAETAIAYQFEGWAYAGCGLVLLLFLPALAKVSWSVVLSGGICGVGLILMGIGYIGALGSQALVSTMNIGGWGVAIFGIYCFYAGFAAITNTVYQKAIIPLGGPLVRSAPVDAAVPDAVAQ